MQINGKNIYKIPDLSGVEEAQKTRLEAWVKALRSGKYKQICDRLRATINVSSSGFCCLGVACDLIEENEKSNLHWVKDPDIFGRWYFGESYEISESGFLSKEVQKLYGLPERYGFSVKLFDSIDSCSLADLNDTWGFTFDDIALVIETAIKGGCNA
jgi:hypothetical protein